MVKDQCCQLLPVCPIVSCLSLTVLSVERPELIIVCYLNIITRNNTKSADVTSWVWGIADLHGCPAWGGGKREIILVFCSKCFVWARLFWSKWKSQGNSFNCLYQNQRKWEKECYHFDLPRYRNCSWLVGTSNWNILSMPAVGILKMGYVKGKRRGKNLKIIWVLHIWTSGEENDLKFSSWATNKE